MVLKVVINLVIIRDKGFKVVIGLRKGPSWDLAKEDGWIEGETLFEITEACKNDTTIMYLLSDADQKTAWNSIKDLIHGKTLYFSYGFSIVFKDKTGVIPPNDCDVIMVAPKGSGTTVLILFLEGRAEERAYDTGIAMGLGYIFPTTFERETYSDLTGKCGIPMGCIQGIFKAQFEVLISNGHTSSEAFNETIYNNCSTTARRGALDWMNKFYSATEPVVEELCESVRNELKELRESQLWQTAVTVRSLCLETQKN
ncbi:6-phosphogluconate dehydrogenase C-terminal domain-like protein [Neocallimastix lanati (nom. inval.)]|nr:6-phosphogluconate dehydrogenase C-terminal domain-like protein [Neocallimastix sp. JGI-2020a]